MNKQRFPRIRFDGFLGDWEKKTLADVSIVERGKFSARPRNDPKFFGGSMPFIQTGDITNSDLFLTNYTQTLNSDGILVSKVFPQKTILITIAANIGDTAITTFDIACPDSVVAIRADENRSNVFFLKYILDLKRAFLNDCATQNAQKNINLQVLNPLEIKLCSLAEQTHLGLFFRRLDSQIAESRAVLEKSRQLKKAMLAKMFPANGEKMPKIRFEGFEGEWKCRKLGDIANFLKGKGLSKSSIDNDGKTPCILYGELYTKYGCYIGKVVSSTSESIENPILTKSNDILLPTSDVTPNGLAKACSIYFDNIVLGGDILVIRSAEMLGLFFSYYVESNPLMIIEKATGTTVFHIYEKDLRDIVLLLPSYEEQTAIGNFFRQLDETIALQSAEVEKLNQLKKGLLAAMLV